MTTSTDRAAERSRAADQHTSGPETARNRPEPARRELHEQGEIPGMEPWLWWALAAFVPMIAGLLLPRVLLVPLLAASGLLLLVAVGKLIVQERRKSATRGTRAAR